MTTRSQGHPMVRSQVSATQHLRERQKFFEDVLQHDADLYYPSCPFLNEGWRPTLDSVSSMEVNIDCLDLTDPLDVTELDAFQQSEDPDSPTDPNIDVEDSWFFGIPDSPDTQQQASHDTDDDDAEGEEESEEHSERDNERDIVSSEPAHSNHCETGTSERG
ncbi:dysbindin domain-containing protein 2 [Xenopus laevis]|uniref:Uncharacterized protein n=2 Tax=Xenopus laevis TaxID=8355 RepID=A0A974CYF4_XENLA|nr:dysbindin domain-containing protein 2 [Xenopus laevis]OCT80985.1 hypothetical protein XELAEV_18027798mg [Xenopus laevis]